MDEFTRLSLGALSDLEQMEAALSSGDPTVEPRVRELLKALIDASDGRKLQFWVRAVGMVASAAAAQAAEEE